MMVWFFAEKQSSIFIEFFNSIGHEQPLIKQQINENMWEHLATYRDIRASQIIACYTEGE
jgi:hypothetical protein